MIIRTLDSGTIIKIHGIVDEQEFLSKNPTGGFSHTDYLPPSSSQQWILVDGQIISDPVADKQVADNMYKQARKHEYPPIEQYIDGIVKGDQAQIDAYIQKCLEIKNKYPKPQDNTNV